MDWPCTEVRAARSPKKTRVPAQVLAGVCCAAALAGATAGKDTHKMKENPSFEYVIFEPSWRSTTRVDPGGKGATVVQESLGGVTGESSSTPIQLKEEQREELPGLMAGLSLLPAEQVKREQATAASFTSGAKGAAWTQAELRAGAPAELRAWVEGVGHPAYCAAEIALRRGEAAEDKSRYEGAAKAYRQGIERLGSWWMPKGLRNDTNVSFQVAVQAEEDRRWAEAAAGFLKVLKIRMEVYRQKYKM